MRYRNLLLVRIAAIATLSALACSNWSRAAEPVISGNSYRPAFGQPSNWSTLRVAQTVQSTAPAGGAQPGQSTVPSPSSSPGTTPPPQGAQPGQSTIPSPSSSSNIAPGPQGAQPGQSTISAPTNSPAGAPSFGTPNGFGTPVTQPGINSPALQPMNVGVNQPLPPAQAPPDLPPAQVVTPPQGTLAPPLEDLTPPPPTTEELLPEQEFSSQIEPSDSRLDGSETPFVDDPTTFEGRQGVRPYGGGHPGDWTWGCNGSPYRTNGMCDDWKVGCRWHITADGIVLSRPDADLGAILNEMPNSITAPNQGLLDTPTFEQFDKEGGGRVTFTSQVGHSIGWDVQFAYEGVPEWNASIVYPVQILDLDYPIDPALPVIIPPLLVAPAHPFPQGTLQRTLHYRTAMHSGELNALTGKRTRRPMFGFRYFSFDDEINDTLDFNAQPPLAGPSDAINVGGIGLPQDPEFQAIGPAVTTDRVNIFDIQNNLMGFQVGLLHDTWQVNQRFAFEGVVNAGVYYNRIKYTNYQGIFTTQVYADNTNSDGNDESRTDLSDVVNNDVREYSEIAYHAEASLTGVCRLNRCWALRGGYQALWIDNVHVAEDAYLGDENVNRDLLFHGWHAGIECRR